MLMMPFWLFYSSPTIKINSYGGIKRISVHIIMLEIPIFTSNVWQLKAIYNRGWGSEWKKAKYQIMVIMIYNKIVLFSKN